MLRAVPSLDLVLTPNGFGIVSNQNVAPASRERVSRLIASLETSRDNAIEQLVTYLFRWAEWRDGVLWYIFVGYLIFSAYLNMRPAWLPGVEKHAFARYAGGLTVWGFAVLLLFMPRSGLSDALQLLGIFTVAWGLYQLFLPPCRE